MNALFSRPCFRVSVNGAVLEQIEVGFALLLEGHHCRGWQFLLWTLARSYVPRLGIAMPSGKVLRFTDLRGVFPRRQLAGA
jgi:hypothetical protein